MNLGQGDLLHCIDSARQIRTAIDQLQSADSKVRVLCMADLFRAMANGTNPDEVVRAMELVVAELRESWMSKP